jgi:ketosteroid isomerase-like protein
MIQSCLPTERQPGGRYSRTTSLLFLALFISGGPVSAQVLPNAPGEAPGTAQAIYQAQVRAELEGVLQEWVNAIHAGDPGTIARFFTDGAVLLAPGGVTASGRSHVAAYWGRSLPALTRLNVVVGDVVARNQIAAAGGRYAARVDNGTGGTALRTGYLLMVFERQRGVWMQRLHAALPDPDPRPGLGAGGGAIGPTGQAPRPPTRPSVRWTLDPYFGAMWTAAEWGGETRSLVGIGAGVEFGELVHLVGTMAHEAGGPDGGAPLRMYGGELRLAIVPGARVKPFVLGGLSYVAGGPGAVPGEWSESLAPVFGAGAALNLTRSLSLNLGARALLATDPTIPGREGYLTGRSHWLTASRVPNTSFSIGLGFAAGGERPWHDPPVLARDELHQQLAAAELTEVLNVWLEARRANQIEQVAGIYSPGAWLAGGDGEMARGREAIGAYLGSRPPPAPGERMEVEDLRAVGNLGLLVTRLVRDAGAGNGSGDIELARHITVLERHQGRWVIRMHMIAESPDSEREPSTSAGG